MNFTVLRSHLNKLVPKSFPTGIIKNVYRSEVAIENGNLQNYNDLDSFLAKCKYVLNRTTALK